MSACGHTRHVGSCPQCQRVQLARWRTQLVAASDAAIGSRDKRLPVPSPHHSASIVGTRTRAAG